MRQLLPLLLAPLVVILPACGGGGGGRIVEAVNQAIRQSVPAQDVSVRGTVSDRGTLFTTTPQVVGDNRAYAWRATMGFDIDEPVEGAAFVGALLRLDIREMRGDVSRLGRLWVEAVDLGDALDRTDYQTPVYASIRVPESAIQTGVLDIDVTELMIEMWASGRRNFDLRLRFSVPNSGDDAEDMLLFETLGLLVEWR